MHISVTKNALLFNERVFSTTISHDVTVRACGFFMRGKGMWLLHFLCSHKIFLIYTGNETVPELRVVARWRIWPDPVSWVCIKLKYDSHAIYVPKLCYDTAP